MPVLATPLREGKGTMFEGGCREPTLMWWPSKISPNSVCSEPAMTIDLPTITKLIEAKLPGHKIDGKNILPLLLKDDAKSPQKAYYFYYGNQLQAVRKGKNYTFHMDIEPWLVNQGEKADSHQIFSGKDWTPCLT